MNEQFPVLFENAMIKVFKNPSDEIFIEHKHSGVQLRIADMSNDLSILFSTNSVIVPYSMNGLSQILVKDRFNKGL
jgi:hypothetical protein